MKDKDKITLEELLSLKKSEQAQDWSKFDDEIRTRILCKIVQKNSRIDSLKRIFSKRYVLGSLGMASLLFIAFVPSMNSKISENSSNSLIKMSENPLPDVDKSFTYNELELNYDESFVSASMLSSNGSDFRYISLPPATPSMDFSF